MKPEMKGPKDGMAGPRGEFKDPQMKRPYPFKVAEKGIRRLIFMGRNDKKWRRKKITKHKHRKMLKKTRHRINK
jgi:hypothetical protein